MWLPHSLSWWWCAYSNTWQRIHRPAWNWSMLLHFLSCDKYSLRTQPQYQHFFLTVLCCSCVISSEKPALCSPALNLLALFIHVFYNLSFFKKIGFSWVNISICLLLLFSQILGPSLLHGYNKQWTFAIWEYFVQHGCCHFDCCTFNLVGTWPSFQK